MSLLQPEGQALPRPWAGPKDNSGLPYPLVLGFAFRKSVTEFFPERVFGGPGKEGWEM